MKSWNWVSKVSSKLSKAELWTTPLWYLHECVIVALLFLALCQTKTSWKFHILFNLLLSTKVVQLVCCSPRQYPKRINSKFEFRQTLIQFNIWFNNGWLNSIQTFIQLKNIGGDSMKSIIQFKCQGIINTGQTRKVVEQCPKCAQKKKKRVFNQRLKISI